MKAKWNRLIAGLVVVGSLASGGWVDAQPAAPDPVRLALAQKYLDVTDMRKQINQVMDGLMPTMMDQIMAQYSGVLNSNEMAALKSAMLETLGEQIPPMTDKMLTAMTPIVAQTYTTQELTDVVAFYSTASGQSMLAKTPQLTQAMAAIMPSLQLDQEAFNAAMLGKLCARIECPRQVKPVPSRKVG